MPRAEFGVMDLSEWDFKEDGLIKLDGEWEFYWNRLLTPNELNMGSYPVKTGVIDVPKYWNDNTVGETLLTGKGCATYRLFIQFENKGGLYSLKTGRIKSAHTIWINSKELVKNGTVATTAEQSSPWYNPQDLHFQTDSNIVEIIIHVSNFQHNFGGISDSITLGLSQDIIQKSQTSWSFTLFLLGILLVMAVYHFGLYIMHRDDPSPLYFGLVCFLSAFNMLTQGDVLFSKYFDWIGWTATIKIAHISNYLRISFFVMYLQMLFKAEINKYFVKIIFYASIAISLFVLIFKPVVFTYFTKFSSAISVIIILYLLVSLSIALYRKRSASTVSLIATLILALTCVNDILHYFLIIQTTFLVPLGMVIFVFLQSFILSIRFSRSFAAEKLMTKSISALDNIKNQLINCTNESLEEPLKIFADNIEAEKGAWLIVHEDNELVLEAIANSKSKASSISSIPLREIDKEGDDLAIPVTIIEQVEKNKRKVYIEDAFKDGRYIIDDYIGKNYIKEVICIPILSNRELKGILYFENNLPKKIFSSEKHNVLDLLSSEILVLIENSNNIRKLKLLNQTLENKVVERTKEITNKKDILDVQTRKIEAQNKMLLEKQQSLEDTLDIAERQKEELNRTNKNITDSILYAERIQNSIFPSDERFRNILPSSFVYFKPKDILSGDFYWIEHVKDNDQIIVAAADCTGHGVPGALLSIVGHNLLNYAVKEQNHTKPSEILDIVEEGFASKLNPDRKKVVQDGLDIAVICYDKKTRTLQFAGAQNPLYLIRDNNLTIIKGDKFTIGGVMRKKNIGVEKFTNKEVKIEKGDLIYIFTDGYADQFGGEKQRKFMLSAFRKLLLTINRKSMGEQKQILQHEFVKWKGDSPQIDDILIVGIKL